MNPFAKSTEPVPPTFEEAEPLELSNEVVVTPSFDQDQWAESRAEERGAGGR